jgi:PEP-CTERM motif
MTFTSVRTSRKLAAVSYAAVGAVIFTLPAQALVTVPNGGFETGTTGGKLGTNATPWSTTSYSFLFAPGTADTTGATNGSAIVKLWGPNNGSANGLPAASPAGGNYVAADGASGFAGPITQTINGLVIGDTYTLGFWWAGAQQGPSAAVPNGFTGATTEQWKVTLGSDTKSTPVVTNSSHGFTGWQFQTFEFTATAVSEVLSFLAMGTPNGVPPFSLLDGVTLDPAAGPGPAPAPEPAILALFGIGLIGIPAVWRMRRKVR